MNSKVSWDRLYKAMREVLHSNQRKHRKFLETVELQVSLKNYDPTIRLQSPPCPRFSMCDLGDQQYCDEAKDMDSPRMGIEALTTQQEEKISQEVGQEV